MRQIKHNFTKREFHLLAWDKSYGGVRFEGILQIEMEWPYEGQINRTVHYIVNYNDFCELKMCHNVKQHD